MSTSMPIFCNNLKYNIGVLTISVSSELQCIDGWFGISYCTLKEMKSLISGVVKLALLEVLLSYIVVIMNIVYANCGCTNFIYSQL